MEITEEEVGDIRTLQERLNVYRQVRRASKLLGSQWNRHPLFKPRKAFKQKPIFSVSSDLKLKNILEAILSSLKDLPALTKMETARVKRIISLDQMIDRLMQKIKKAMKDTFGNMTKGSDKVESIVGFLALLELVKRGSLNVTQDGAFDDISVEHNFTPHESR